MAKQSQGVIFLGFLLGGVLIYSAVTDNSVFSVLSGKATGGHGDIDDDTDQTNSDTTNDVGAPGSGIDGCISAADAINDQDLPYVLGGGHDAAGTPSGSPPGYDCSGVTAAVLAGGGFWKTGSSVPTDAGIISALKAQGIIAPGLDTGTPSINIFDNPGDHIFLSLNGRYFGTSDGEDGTGNHTKFGKGGGGGTWLTSGPDVPIFQHYHIVDDLLEGSSAGDGSTPSDASAAGDDYHHG
jgi:hypothetical protein